ncbi:hypothetical protein SBOR_8571 [Sclerotinia borealis F-4128]|uniref:Thioredoxin-like fold domain-containing protein n=1 Tax=Sclerotinia borealis (strain F-4128) TaxID=1432307 RepID=W9C2N7_SCLBF|nr:hypothetical protein SBOR_8571 [Sclerotinia borealis F-4128]
MALPPKFAGQRFVAMNANGKANVNVNLYTLELYLDYVCPFSAKMFNTIYTSVMPLIKEKYSDKVQIIFRQHIQPWHPSSTLVHEAGVAVLNLSPSLFYPFSFSLFQQQKSFFDVNVVNETRNATYKRLAKIGGEVGVDEGKMFDLLKIGDRPGEDGSLNAGNGVTDQLKVLVKMNRLVGIHVTPTVVFDGVVENSISSSFTAEQWEDWLNKNVV